MKCLSSRLIAVFFFFSFAHSAQSADWAGVFGGIHVGYGWADTGGIYDTSQASAENRTPLGGLDVEGVIGGGQIGLNLQSSSFVYGLAADIAGGDLSDDILSNETAAAGLLPKDNINADFTYLATIRGQLGITMGQFLVYGTAGVYFTEVELKITDSSPGNGAGSGKLSIDDNGWVYGLGIAYQQSETISVSIEYLRFDLDISESLFQPSMTTNPDVDPGDFFESSSLDLVRLGLNIKLSSGF